jgi:hypothetical protein
MIETQGNRRFQLVLHDEDIFEAGERWDKELEERPPPPGYPAHHKDAPSKWDALRLLELVGEVSGISMEVMDMVDTNWLRNIFVQLRKLTENRKAQIRRKKPRQGELPLQ